MYACKLSSYIGCAVPWNMDTNILPWPVPYQRACGDTQKACAGIFCCMQAYTWLLVWYIFFTFEATYVKHVCDTVHMSNWGRVYYTNILAGMVLLAAFPFCTSERDVLRATDFSWNKVMVLGLSCIVGAGMSHAGYLLRSNVSATSSVVVGVVCKIGSVLINLLIWDQHANGVQLAFLLLGLLGGAFFEQAPLRQPATAVVQSAGGGKNYQKAGHASSIVVEVAAGSSSRESSADGHSSEAPRDS